MKRADEMTVEEMAGVLGYTRDRDGDWLDEGGPVVCRWGDGRWASWPVGARANGQREHSSQHAALARLYALRFPDADATDEPDPEPAATLPLLTGGISARAKAVPIPPGATAAVLGTGPEGACLSFGFPETTGTPTPAPIVEPAPTTARESGIPFALDTRAVLEWLDSPVPLDEDRRPRFLRMAEAIGRAVGGGR